MAKAITLWMEGLLSPQRIEEADQAWSELSLPVLQSLLKKADIYPAQGLFKSASSRSFYQTASNLFHQPQTLPVAATTASSQLSASFDADCFWIKVDPVQFVADRDTLVLLPGKDLAITDEEAQALISSFNEHFAVDQVEIEIGSATDWYVRVKQPVDVLTTPLDQVAYQSIENNQPSGNAAAYWRKLLNEASMLFYTHPVNETRRLQNQPEINGLWLWGEGKLDYNQTTLRQQAKIWSSNAYLQGVAGITQAQISDKDVTLDDCLQSDKDQHFIVPQSWIEYQQDVTLEQWLKVVETLETEWMQPLQAALKSGQVNSVLLELGDGHRYHLQPSHLKRFWRWKKRL